MNDSTYGAREAYQDTTVAQRYETSRFSGLTGKLGNWLDRRAVHALLSAHLPPGARVLDLPAGTGRFLDLLAPRYTITGADVSLEMLGQARRRNAQVDGATFAQADATRLPFATDAFDCVMSIRFLGHLPDDVRRRAFAEMARVSRAYVLIEACLNAPIPRATRRLRRRLTGRRPYLPGQWRWRTFDRDELFAECEGMGWRLVARRPKLWPLSDAWFLLYRVP